MLRAPANAQRLADEQIDDIGSLIRGYLIEGKPAFRLRETPTVGGGDRGDPRRRRRGRSGRTRSGTSTPTRKCSSSIERFRALGIDGVEAFYVTHDERQTRLLAGALRSELGLLSTGSADYHGPENRLFSRFLAFDTYDLEPNLGPIAD